MTAYKCIQIYKARETIQRANITKFEIRLHDPLAVYYAGQTIAGQVFLELSAELNFGAITLEMHGDANVSVFTVAWTEEEGSRDNLRTIHYKNSETYLNIEQYLIGDGKEERKLPAGCHNLPFSIALPTNIPATFIGDHGRVQYNLSAKIDRRTRLDINLDVTVVSLLDLNQDPSAASPRTISGSKKFGFLCCTSGPLSATLSFPKLGWVGGETISFSASIENLSNKVMTKSTIQLIERDVFISSCGHQRTVNKTLLTDQKGMIAPGASFTWIWSDVDLLLPPLLPPSHFIHCNIIDIMYIVVLSVHPSGIGSDLNVPVIITIGTIPLRQQEQVQHINLSQYQPDANASPPDISAPPPDISVPPTDISAPAQNVNAPAPNVNAPPQDISAPPPYISAPPPDISAPPRDISAPPPDISAPPPSYEEVMHGGAAM
ncbi:arrestin domain-containing protein 17-like [Bolinopsis microptera]|uniref:arrestin domain-containing protein 17-like n=1 Tax=Bolinopsis microptera TaxID=2820187 RepID=UPI00307ADBFE